MPKTLTLAQLKAVNACPSQVKRFEERFGESVEVTVELAVAVAHLFDWDFAAENFLSASPREIYIARAAAQKLYDETMAAAQKLYDETMAAAQKLYDETMAAAQKLYGEARAAAWKVYGETLAAAWKVYGETLAAAWKLYGETRAAAFATAYLSMDKEV